MFKNLVVLFTIFMLFSGVALAQKEDSMFNFNLAAGTIFSIGEDDETFSFDGMAGLLHVDVIGFDFMDATSGIGLEVNYNGMVQYTVWSLNRLNVPGSNDLLYAGSDFKLLQSTTCLGELGLNLQSLPHCENAGIDLDFDVRLVTGTRVGKIGPGNLKFEFYFIEENRPISFAVLYDW